MQSALNCPPQQAASGPEVHPTFNVVIAYEDFETGKHAKKTYDFLVENLGSDCQFSNQMWKFDVLRIPKLRDIAAKDATLADIVIVSSHGGNDLPPEVRGWIESWLQAPNHPLALVALFDCGREQTRCIRAYLAGIARRGHMEFFAQPDQWPGSRREEAAAPLQRGSQLNQKALFTLAGVVQQDPGYPRWEMTD